ncbi:MAG: DUF3147 family protein [Candidatus Margulisiibacteriota bacterium]|jgi:hypothetical protein
MPFLIKIFISAIMIAAISEIGKRVSWVAAILASIPLTSVLALCWLYFETRSIEKVVELSKGIFWAVLPSLLFFVALPILLNAKIPFGWSMALSIAITAIGYFFYGLLLAKMGLLL